MNQRGTGILQDLDGELTADGWKVLKKGFKAIASFKMLEKYAHGHPRASEYRGASKNLRVHYDVRGFHEHFPLKSWPIVTFTKSWAVALFEFSQPLAPPRHLS